MDTPTQSTLPPAEVAAAMVASGAAKHRTRLDLIFFKAVLAGVMLSFGGLLSLIANGGSAALTASNPGLVKLIGGAVFPVGLVMIVLQGLELLTSNMMVLPLAAWRGRVPLWSIPLNLIVVTFGNLCGSLFFANVLVKHAGILASGPYIAYAQSAALKKAADPTFTQIFIRGIGCNWLVCVAVWQAAGAKDTLSKIVAIWIPIWVFVACGFDHVVANMFSIPLGIMFGADLSTAAYIRKSLIAAWLGNLVGALLVAAPAAYFYLPSPFFAGRGDADAQARAVEEGAGVRAEVEEVGGQPTGASPGGSFRKGQ